jgi:hypothetical protein
MAKLGSESFDGSHRLDISVSEQGIDGVIRKMNQIAAAVQRLSPEAAMSLRGEALRLGEHLESVVRGAAVVTLQTAVLSTPVDTGLARAGWTVKITRQSPQSHPTPETDRDGLRTIEEGTTTINNTDREPGEIYWISNSQHHIRALEEGHSGQAPNGMTTLAKQAGTAYARNKRINFRGKP